jgi:hypothetical protein
MYRKLINALVLTEVSAHPRRNRKDRRKPVFFRASLGESGIYETEKAGTCGIPATAENPKICGLVAVNRRWIPARDALG